MSDFFLRGFSIGLKQIVGRHQESGRAKATLQPVVFPEGFLQRMEFPISGEALDSEDFRAGLINFKNQKPEELKEDWPELEY